MSNTQTIQHLMAGTAFTLTIEGQAGVSNVDPLAFNVSQQGSLAEITVVDGSTDPIIIEVNGTSYSEDVDGNILTAALIAERPRFLRAPSITGTGDQRTDIIGDIGLVVKDNPNLNQSFVWHRDGVVVNEAQNLDYLVGIADESSDLTLVSTVGATTSISDPKTIAPVDLSEDTGAVWWHNPDNVTVSSGALQSWPNSSIGGSPAFSVSSVPTGAVRPSWDATTKEMVLGGTNALIGPDPAPEDIRSIAYTDGKEIATFVVARLTTESPWGALLALGYNSGYGRTFYMGYGMEAGNTTDADLVWVARHWSNAFGSAYGSMSSPGVIPPGLHLLEVRISPTEARFFVDGVLELSGTYSSEALPGAEGDSVPRLSLGARASLTAYERPAKGGIRETFATTSTTYMDRARSILAAKHGITIS